jgi:hypothetical protein
MAKKFDATLNALIDDHLDDWARFLCARAGVPVGPAAPLDTDLSTTLQADRLFHVDGVPPAVVHLELESTGRRGIPGELLRYNVAAWGVTGLPVHSVLVLLRPKATATDLTGRLEVEGADGRAYLGFDYTVVRVWQETVESLLGAGVGVAPLALLTNEAEADLDGAFDRFVTRLQTAGVPATVEQGLLGSTYVLCGLRYTPERVEALYRNFSMTLEDSTTYQQILTKGVTKGVTQGRREAGVRMLVRFGTARFGAAPSPEQLARLNAIADPDRIEQLADRLPDAAGWDELLAAV